MSTPVFQAPGVQVYGAVTFDEGVTLWPNAVIRAEMAHIHIGAYTNIQDFAMLHIGGGPVEIGAYCSITHHATIHGAKIGNHCLIGINATIMDGAEIGDNSIVAGNTIIREGTVVPPNSIVAGVPGKVITTRNNYPANKVNAQAYYLNGLAYLEGNHRLWSEPQHIEQMQSLLAEYEAELERGEV